MRRSYGPDAPRWAERIHVDPRAIEVVLAPPGTVETGSVVGGDWDLDVLPVDDIDRVRYCRLHFVDGLSWEETGAYEAMRRRIAERRDGRVSVDGCASEEDIIARYARIDALYEECRRLGRLRTRAEVAQRPFRENYGVLVHIGRDGQPIFGHHGCHRLAVSQILGLPTIPAQLGIVHPDALGVWRARYGAPVVDPVG